ncbi:MAG: serine hydroxymethyltransferase [bacterium]|nr:serine hydroxymethyltransferase [bacterium]
MSKGSDGTQPPCYQDIDARLHDLITKETERQNRSLNMVAAANCAPDLILDSLGNPFLNIVAEGYLGRRFHRGTENYDQVEQLGISLASEIFGAGYVNLKPHSATQAVQASLLALKKDGRNKILAMDLRSGGHITHTRATGFNRAMRFNILAYSVDENFDLDYDEIRRFAKSHEVEIIVAGASAFPKVIDWRAFNEIARETGARLVADISHFTGLIAAGTYPSPLGIADIVVASTSKTLPGPKGGLLLMGKNPDEKLKIDIDNAVNVGLQSEDISNALFSKVKALALVYHPEFVKYAARTIENAKTLAEFLHESGLAVVGYSDESKGTDSHMLLLDLRSCDGLLTGVHVARELASVGIYANRNLVPNDTRLPLVTSGVRLSTSGVSILGMGKDEMLRIGSVVKAVVESDSIRKSERLSDEDRIRLSAEIATLRQEFPCTVFDSTY